MKSDPIICKEPYVWSKSDFDTEQHESLMQKALRHTKKAICLIKSDPYYMQRATRLIKKWIWRWTARISD